MNRDLLRHDVFMSIAKNIARLSTCAKHHVGSVIVKDSKIIGIGYNGVPGGKQHCSDIFDRIDMDIEAMSEYHHNYSAENEIHAEMNAILNCYDLSKCKGAILYSTHKPCYNCQKHIELVGITTVRYEKEYSTNVFDKEV